VTARSRRPASRSSAAAPSRESARISLRPRRVPASRSATPQCVRHVRVRQLRITSDGSTAAHCPRSFRGFNASASPCARSAVTITSCSFRNRRASVHLLAPLAAFTSTVAECGSMPRSYTYRVASRRNACKRELALRVGNRVSPAGSSSTAAPLQHAAARIRHSAAHRSTATLRRVAPTISSCAHTHRYTSTVLNLLVRMNTPYSRLGNLGAFAVYREGARRERDSFCIRRPISNHSCDASVNAASHFRKIQCPLRLSSVYFRSSPAHGVDFIASC